MSTPEQPKLELPARWEDRRSDGTYGHNPYAAEVTPNGVNISALRRNRRLTLYERLERLKGWTHLADELRSGMRQARK